MSLLVVFDLGATLLLPTRPSFDDVHRPIKPITHRALRWQIRKGVWFGFSTPRTCSHTALTVAQALTFTRESDERNILLTKKMLRVLRDISLFPINPKHRKDTFTYLPITLHRQRKSQLPSHLQLWMDYHMKCHTPLWPEGVKKNKSVLMNQAASFRKDLHCGNRKWMMTGEEVWASFSFWKQQRIGRIPLKDAAERFKWLYGGIMSDNLMDGWRQSPGEREREFCSSTSLAQQFSRTAERGCQETAFVHLLSSASCSKAKLYSYR